MIGESPPHRGVDRNTAAAQLRLWPTRRPLTGAWIETPITSPRRRRRPSPPHRGVDRNWSCTTRRRTAPRRPLTGAWIETRSERAHGNRHEASPPHRGVDRNPDQRRKRCCLDVAPSQGRGSKLSASGQWSTPNTQSPPHRGVDRNGKSNVEKAKAVESPPHRGVDRNADIMQGVVRSLVAPSQGRGSKRRWRRRPRLAGVVAPSQGRGSKQERAEIIVAGNLSPPHRGVDRNRSTATRARRAGWSPPHRGVDRNVEIRHAVWTRQLSPPHRGVDRNDIGAGHRPLLSCRPLTGAWIETSPAIGRWFGSRVAPSQGRGSKLDRLPRYGASKQSPPHRGVDRNCEQVMPWLSTACRPLTGAWIETLARSIDPSKSSVAPSQGRGSKRGRARDQARRRRSPPHRGVDRNSFLTRMRPSARRRPLTGAWIETCRRRPARQGALVAPSQGRGSKLEQLAERQNLRMSPPHRGVDRNGL